MKKSKKNHGINLEMWKFRNIMPHKIKKLFGCYKMRVEGRGGGE